MNMVICEFSDINGNNNINSNGNRNNISRNLITPIM